jgi:hypothetical protein
MEHLTQIQSVTQPGIDAMNAPANEFAAAFDIDPGMQGWGGGQSNMGGGSFDVADDPHGLGPGGDAGSGGGAGGSPGGGSPGGGGVGGPGGGEGGTADYHQGGKISEKEKPGTAQDVDKTLQEGEFVMSRAAVQAFGDKLFEVLNNAAKKGAKA